MFDLMRIIVQDWQWIEGHSHGKVVFLVSVWLLVKSLAGDKFCSGSQLVNKSKCSGSSKQRTVLLKNIGWWWVFMVAWAFIWFLEQSKCSGFIKKRTVLLQKYWMMVSIHGLLSIILVRWTKLNVLDSANKETCLFCRKTGWKWVYCDVADSFTALLWCSCGPENSSTVSVHFSSNQSKCVFLLIGHLQWLQKSLNSWEQCTK